MADQFDLLLCELPTVFHELSQAFFEGFLASFENAYCVDCADQDIDLIAHILDGHAFIGCLIDGNDGDADQGAVSTDLLLVFAHMLLHDAPHPVFIARLLGVAQRTAFPFRGQIRMNLPGGDLDQPGQFYRLFFALLVLLEE